MILTLFFFESQRTIRRSKPPRTYGVFSTSSLAPPHSVRRNRRCLARLPRNLKRKSQTRLREILRPIRMPVIQVPVSALRLIRRKARIRVKSTCAHRLVSGSFMIFSPSPTLLLRFNVSFVFSFVSRILSLISRLLIPDTYFFQISEGLFVHPKKIKD